MFFWVKEKLVVLIIVIVSIIRKCFWLYGKDVESEYFFFYFRDEVYEFWMFFLIDLMYYFLL